MKNKLADRQERIFYGIGEMAGKDFKYSATVKEKQEGEAERYNYKAYIIEKGTYLTSTLKD